MSVETAAKSFAMPASTPARRDLVIYTLWYPYGDSEWFLHTELQVIAPLFDRIFIIPSHHSSTPARQVPENVQVVEPLGHADDWRCRWSRRVNVLKLFGKVLAQSKDRWHHLRGFSHMQTAANSELGRLQRLRDFIQFNKLEQALHYDYWFFNNSLPLAWMRQRGEIRALVCRAHGFDLYDERHPLCLPFRDFRVEGLDAVVTISRHGANYLRSKVAWGHARKIRMMPLGIDLSLTSLGPHPSRDEAPVLVSCSRIHPVKRVEAIIAALAEVRVPLRWVHIGDGPGRAELELAASVLPPNIEWEFRGAMDNPEVFNFYRNQPITALINLSSMEGLPVSMMEAAAFGIPLIGTEVGGVPEIISYSTGVLVSPDAEPDTVARQIEFALQREWNREAIREEMLARFDARASFSAFAEFLLSFLQEEEVSERTPRAAPLQMRLSH